MTPRKKTSLIVLASIFLISGCLCFVRNDFEIAKNLDIYATLLRQVNEYYVDDIQVGDMVKTSIDAMLKKLDPYTVFYPESDLEEFKLMTTGQYGGIGALIQQDSDYVIISEPYEGTPAMKAGLQAGDRILAIDGKNAKGKSVSDISTALKGQPGTIVKLTIQPYGKKGSVIKEIERKEIKLPSITYSGMIDQQTGYIRLSQFTDNAGKEVREAFLKLKEQHMKSFVLDLRDNGGGLLNEAVNIVGLFVPKGELVVSTKGKMAELNQQFYTTSDPIDTEIPIIVLVNGNSASASEIVSGALQDLDRAVVIGTRTFGKGLVQNVLPLSYNTRLKVTVSKYYIPSGRCIQKIDYAQKDENGANVSKADSTATAFRTRHGRTVYDYGGVEPDLKVEMENYSTVLLALIEKRIIFNYANEFKNSHKSIAPAGEFQFTDDMYEEFLAYVRQQDIQYETFTEKEVKLLEEAAKDDKMDKAVEKEIDALRKAIEKEKAGDFQKYRKEISEMLCLEIVSRYYYLSGESEAALKIDPYIQKVHELFDKDGLPVYHSILKGKGK